MGIASDVTGTRVQRRAAWPRAAVLGCSLLPSVGGILAVVAMLVGGAVGVAAQTGPGGPASAARVAGVPGAGASAAAQPSAGVPVAQIPALWPRLTPKQQFAAAEQLIRVGEFRLVEDLLKRTTYPHAGDTHIRNFYIAMAMKGQGRHQEAVDGFRHILAAKPEFSRVRMELAHSLFALNEDESARHHFELLLGSAATQPGFDTAVRSYINAIDGRRRWDFTAFVTIAPSTNLNQGSSTRTVDLNGLPFTLSEKNIKKSGVGVYGGFQAGYRHPLSESVDLVVAGGAQAKRYKTDDFNDTLLNLSIGPRWRFGWGFLGVYATGDKRWYADDDYSMSYGALVSGGLQLGRQAMLYADVGCSKRRYDDHWNGGDDLTYQDGSLCFLTQRLDYHFDTRTFGRLLGTVSKEDTDKDHLDSRTLSGGVGLYREMPFGISLYLQALFSDVAFKGDYPSADFARHDKRWDFSVNVTKRDLDIFGFAPQVQYTYTSNDSNVAIHDYDAHGVNITLTKRF